MGTYFISVDKIVNTGSTEEVAALTDIELAAIVKETYEKLSRDRKLCRDSTWHYRDLRALLVEQERRNVRR